MKTKVALYARVSTREQETDNQLSRLRKLAEVRDYDVIGEYVDVASGADQNRPRLNTMLDTAKKGGINKIIATKLDRLARSVINLSEIAHDLKGWGVDLEFIDQPIDTGTPSGRLTYVILSAVAEFERELISDRTKDGLARARAEGKIIGRPKKQLSEYQENKLRAILKENPDISMRALSAQFEGISRTRLSEIVKEGNYREL